MTERFTVLGAGIIGVCTALALQRDGHQVTIIDRDEPGRGCSFGNAGIIHTGGCVPMATPGILKGVPKMLLDPEGALVIRWRYLPRLLPWLFKMLAAARPERVTAICKALAHFSLQARNAYLPLLDEARASALLRPRGELYVYRTKAAFDAEAWSMRVRRGFGIPVEDLGAGAIRDTEPALSTDYQFAHYQPASAFMVSPFRLVQSLAALFVRKGGVIQRANVEAVRPGNEGAAVLSTSEGEVSAAHLVICAGAFSKPFAAAFGVDVPLESWRGYHIMVPSAGVPLNGIVADGEMHFAVTPMEDGIRVAGLIELASVDAPPNYARADLFVRLAKRLLPTFPDTPASRWMGHRPGMPDTLPVLGRAPRHPKVYFAFGHGQLGLTFGAITGQTIADLVAGRTVANDLAAYDALRFQ
jgi:glycine/D-amino acid oxidase-like deaminating enzyme